MSKKKILVFIDWYQPGFRAGGPIRSCVNLISNLSNEFDFYVVTRNHDYMDETPYPSVSENSWTTSKDGSHIYYISKERLSRNMLSSIIQSEKWDAVYLNGIFSWHFTLLPLTLLRKNGIKTIIAVRGMLAPGALSVKPIKKKIFLLFSRIIGLFDNAVFQATNNEEKKQIEDYFPKSKIVIAPNLPAPRTATSVNTHQKNSGCVKLVSVARIAPEKNLAFALRVLQDVKGKVDFDFYGPVYDKNYWRECLRIISILPSNIKVNYNGPASPDEVARIIPQYHFLFMPSRGENFGHIILESLALGKPVIISNATPWRGLELMNAGWDLALNEPQSFKEVIERCVKMDQTEYDQLCKGAFDFASTYIKDEEKLNANRQLFS